MPTFIRCIVAVVLSITVTLVFADEEGQWETAISTGVTYRQQGHLSLSIDLLTQARQAANTDEKRMRAMGELGATLLQARQFDQADVSLQEAYSFFSGIERARYALDLGNLAVARKRQVDAKHYYEEALQLYCHGISFWGHPETLYTAGQTAAHRTGSRDCFQGMQGA